MVSKTLLLVTYLTLQAVVVVVIPGNCLNLDGTGFYHHPVVKVQEELKETREMIEMNRD